jgi:hypothetical protein
MDFHRFAEGFRSAEGYDFLPAPIPVPPMIESAFGYRGHSQYVGQRPTFWFVGRLSHVMLLINISA